MSVFDLDTEGANIIAEQAMANPVPVSEVGVGFWEGIGPAVDKGVMRGGIKVADTALTALDSMDSRPTMSGYRGTNRLLPSVAQGVAIRTPEEEQAREAAQAEWRKNALDYWTPNANEVGTAGRVLGGLSEIVLPLMVGGGNPAPLVGSTVVQTRKDLLEQGVDPETATSVGLTEGLATAVGFKLPFLGQSLAAKMATGAGGNLALGTISTQVDRSILEAGGYEEVAQQFDPFSAEARTVDLLSGFAFGGIAHLARPSVRDASLTANNAKHYQQDTAPGIPADTASSVIHQGAIEQALRDLEAGDPVSVPDNFADATYLKRPETPPATDVIRENIAVPEPVVRLTDERAAGQAEEFLVYRAANSEGLVNVNAGDSLAVGSFLQRLDDVEGSVPKGRGKTESVYVYAVKTDGVGPYKHYSQGRTTEPSNVVGRQQDKGIVYSFPEGGKYTHTLKLKISVDEIRAELKRISGYDNFDDAGGSLSGQALKNVAEQRLYALDAIPSDGTLSAADSAIESRFREQLQRDPDAAMKAYAKLEDAAGGKVLNTDIARELSPDYLADRTKSAAVHEPASALVKRMYEQKLAEAPKRGEKPVVLFSAGGTGAGKTTGIKAIGGIDDVQIVYDSNMNSFDSAVTRIDKALNAGKDVKILYTYRDPVEALTGGALPRAMRQEGEFGSGRTVPIAEHAKTHEGSAKVLHELADKYKDNPRVDIMVVDNSKGKGKHVLSDISAVPKEGYTQLERKLNEALETEKSAGRISESVYKGFKGEAESGVQKPSGKQGAQPADSASGSKESQRIVEPLAVETAAADQALAVKDLAIPTGEIDADGNPRTVSARELMAQAKQDVAQAKKESTMFETAVTCFLTAGP